MSSTIPVWMMPLIGTHIQKINQPFADTVVVEVFHHARQSWIFSINSHIPRIYQTERHFRNPPNPPLFCLWLRHRINGYSFENMVLIHPQVIQFCLNHPQGPSYFLIWEDNGSASNLLLLDENNTLLMAMNNPNQAGRKLSQGMSYILPEKWFSPFLLNPKNMDDLKNDQYFLNLEQAHSCQLDQAFYHQHFKHLKKKIGRRLSKQEMDLKQCQQHALFQKWGELLKSSMNTIIRGQSSVRVVDYFDEHLTPVSIPLDEKISPRENMDRLFKKAAKLKKAIPMVEERMIQSMTELEELDLAEQQMETVRTFDQMELWKTQLPAFISTTAKKSMKQSNQQFVQQGPVQRISRDGLMIIIGRNARQNEQVTFHMANGNDWWFHAQQSPGAHVVVKYPKSPLPPKTLEDAVHLAAYYSKIRQNEKIEVVYTQRKYVRKIKGSQPGTVSCSQTSTMYVSLNLDLVHKLLDQTDNDT
ncbi:MAG: DUF814 domain-containing protein [SAR324 cluster bacterium]|nr:DUF814 domain-containing protein [SAR324 cluster bacterium]